MINDTFHFNHIGLLFCLSIFEGCIYCVHVLYYCSRLDVVHNLFLISFVRNILVLVILFTPPTLDSWYSSFSQGVFLPRFIFSNLLLLICCWSYFIKTQDLFLLSFFIIYYSLSSLLYSRNNIPLGRIFSLDFTSV